MGHSVAKNLVLKHGNKNCFAVEASMQRVSAMVALVMSDGRLCALKPSEWSLLLFGVAICGVATMLFLFVRV